MEEILRGAEKKITDSITESVVVEPGEMVSS